MVWSFLTETIGTYWIIFNTLFCLLAYQYIFKNWNHFTKRNVKFIRGIPLLGTQYKIMFGLEPFLNGIRRIYDRFPNEQFFGIFEMGGKPRYVIRDPELIKQVAIKDFEHFMNHGFDIHEDSDPMFGRSLFIMRDQRWKDMRSTLSPAFTGSKMRLMFALIGDVSKKFCDYLNTAECTQEYDAKELSTRFANDTIASCAFGLDMNSMKDKDNHFYKIGQSISNFEGLSLFKFLGYSAFPEIMNFFKIALFKAEDINYFRRIILDNINYREKNNIVRNDMINILMETKKAVNNDQESVTSKWTDDDLIAQSMVFFLAGFGTVSLTISFAIHELVVNPDVQEKLYQEISDVQTQLDGSPLTYEALNKMKYMDMVLSETMRRWPQSPANDRIVTKPYTLEGSNGLKVQLNVGDLIWIPVAGIHMDPKYYPNPEKFDPERFNNENKENISAATFMPFGLGPRICIASRFAIMECKAFLFHLMTHFHLDRSPRTQDVLVLKTSGSVEAKNGFWFKLRPRT